MENKENSNLSPNNGINHDSLDNVSMPLFSGINVESVNMNPDNSNLQIRSRSKGSSFAESKLFPTLIVIILFLILVVVFLISRCKLR